MSNLIEPVRKEIERARNIIRLAEYKARRAAFVEKWSKTPDNDYTAYYGADMAGYIDARYWYEMDRMNKVVDELEGMNKKQAF